MTLEDKTARRPAYFGIPIFRDSGLFIPNAQKPTPNSEHLVTSNQSIDLFFVGEYKKGDAFIFKPKDNSGRTFHLEHRFLHNPIEDLGISSPNLPHMQQIRAEIDSRKDTYFDEENYKKLLETPHRVHRLTQELIRDHAGMISRIIDPTLIDFVEPECFLEVGVDFTNRQGVSDRFAIDAVLITHGGTVVLIEVASRKQINDDQTDDDLRRTKKYRQIIKYSKKFRNQIAQKLRIEEKDLNIVEACVYYEEIEDNEIYASFRFPQGVKPTEVLVI